MKRFCIICMLFATAIMTASAQSSQTHTISGTVTNKNTGEPVEYATVVLTSTEQWAVADAQGRFSIQNVQSGKNVISVSCLGFVTDTKEIVISKDILNYKVALPEDNLTLDSVVITAQDNSNSATTSRTIDKAALDHIQMVNVADVSSLLPGGVTANPSLLSNQVFNIRAGSSEAGSASFGTAVEVDGVRLSNNASFGGLETGSSMTGAVVNNIASTNVESIEIITGVPSVEYGDMTSGVVKINTRKGRTPYTVTLTTNPNMKQVSASKGFGLGESKRGVSKGVLNASLEYSRATSDLRSPYTSYDRSQLQLTYSNLFDRGALTNTPLRFTVSASGNLGGMDNKSDPDAFSETRTTTRDNSFRGSFNLDWLLSKKWITNVELSGSVVYSDKLSREHSNYSLAQDTPVIHGREEGYFVAQHYEDNPDAPVLLRRSGYHYSTMCVDDRPINYGLKFKADWARKFGEINNKIKLGVDWSADGNLGTGEYTEDMATAPSFWEYRYCDVPFINSVSAYIEENITIPIGKTRLNLIAGLRNDNTVINGSAYGTTSGLSPRFNLKYTILSAKERWNKTVKELSLRASWGVATKLPSYSVLYPRPSYFYINTFSSTSTSDGRAYSAWYILPRTIDYNPDLKWQKNRQAEIGFDINIGGNRISLAGYFNRTLNDYRLSYGYDRFTYNYTEITALDNCNIPAENRQFSVDRETGIITVSDATGVLPSETLAYSSRNRLNTRTYPDNGTSPIDRYGLEWVVDFQRINPINTTIRLDGSFYGYRSVDQSLQASAPISFTMSGTGNPYTYTGYYFGGDSYSNGRETKRLNTNLTITTHIPKVRMIVSLRLETTLFRYSRYLNEADGGTRAYRLADRNDITSFTDESIYRGNGYAAVFPEYYTTFEDPYTMRDYLTDLLWAKENDSNLYNDLSRLAITNSNNYYFKKDYISPYFSMNFSVTKEIGDIASISFYANNFFNNFGQVYSTRTETYSDVSSYIPRFYYGLTLRFKF